MLCSGISRMVEEPCRLRWLSHSIAWHRSSLEEETTHPPRRDSAPRLAFVLPSALSRPSRGAVLWTLRPANMA